MNWCFQTNVTTISIKIFKMKMTIPLTLSSQKELCFQPISNAATIAAEKNIRHFWWSLIVLVKLKLSNIIQGTAKTCVVEEDLISHITWPSHHITLSWPWRQEEKALELSVSSAWPDSDVEVSVPLTLDRYHPCWRCLDYFKLRNNLLPWWG